MKKILIVGSFFLALSIAALAAEPEPKCDTYERLQTEECIRARVRRDVQRHFDKQHKEQIEADELRKEMDRRRQEGNNPRATP